MLAPSNMSASLLTWPAAPADGLLTDEECSYLLDVDILNDDDLMKGFPSAPKFDSKPLHGVQEEGNTLYPPSPLEEKPSHVDLENELLQQLENQCKQENIFSNWLEEKVDLPIFENIQQLPERVELQPAPVTAYHAPQPTEELLREFETVYGAVELTHLTPPQSPPGPATQLLLSYAQQHSTSAEWQQSEVNAVDELVRRRAEQLTSPDSSPSSSPRSSTDDEWHHARPKPYPRSDDRRSRKKEQNKNAATRYRQKKKAEIEVLLNEEQGLRQKHSELGDKCTDLQREIRYLKGLMRDLFKAKGLIK